MIFCNLHSIFGYLPNFVPLIQLLAGSLFIATVFFKKDGLEIKDDFESVSDDLNKIQGLIPDKYYKYTESVSFNADFTFLQKKIMLLLAVYSCIVLFFCSIFRCCYTPSSFGLGILSVLMFLFQLYAVIAFKKRGLLKTIEIVSRIILILFFFIFLIFIVLFNNIGVAELLTDYINMCVILNMILWVLLYCERILLLNTSKKDIHKVKNELENINKLELEMHNIKNLCDSDKKFNNIINEISNIISKSKNNSVRILDKLCEMGLLVKEEVEDKGFKSKNDTEKQK